MNHLTPLLLEGPGRAGSTLLATILKHSEKIIVDPKYPHEWRYINYLNSLAKNLIQSTPNHVQPIKIASSTVKILPPTPFDPSLTRDLPFDFYKEFMSNIWTTISKYARSAHPDSIYYVEKAPSGLTEEIRSFIPETKRIYRIRDPRDIWISIIQFDKKRGYYGFGRKENQTESEYLYDFIESQKLYLNKAITLLTNKSSNDHLVKYEDLILNQEKEISKISDFLGVNLDAKYIPYLKEHATSNSAIESIEKWKNHKKDKSVKIITQELSGQLEEVGYQTKTRKIFSFI